MSNFYFRRKLCNINFECNTQVLLLVGIRMSKIETYVYVKFLFSSKVVESIYILVVTFLMTNFQFGRKFPEPDIVRLSFPILDD